MEYEQLIEEQLNNLKLNDLNEIMNQAGQQSGFGTSMTAQDIVQSLVSGQPLFDSEVLIHSIKDLFLYEVKSSLILGIQLVTVCIIIGLLKNLSSSLGEKPVSNLGILVCSCFVMALCMKNFTYTYNLCADTLHTMSSTMQILLPLLIPLLVSLGGFASGSVLNPVIVGAITIFNTILQKFILPAVFISSVFILINSMTEKDYVNKLALFLRGAATFATGLCVTFFTGITVIQGMVTESADGLLVNTARYSINNFVPIVGGFAADSVDMVIGCVGIIKNGLSLFGVIIIITLLAVPIIKLMAVAVIYKLTAIAIEPIGNKPVSDCLNEMGNSVITMAVILFLAALMFLIFLTIIISIGGGKLWQL